MVIQKTTNRFSSMPIGQAREQNNELVKGSGGAVGLMETCSHSHILICNFYEFFSF